MRRSLSVLLTLLLACGEFEGARRPHADRPTDGLETADDFALRRYYEDLALLLTPSERVEWSALPGSERASWIRRRWALRAAAGAVTLEERIAEHHRRVARAYAEFRRAGVRVANMPVIDQESPFDDRGIIHIRHGEPGEVISGPLSRSGVQRTAWIYPGIGEGTAIFEFSRRPGWLDYRLGAPLACEPWVYKYRDPGPAAERKFWGTTDRIRTDREIGRPDPDSLPTVTWQSDMTEDFLGYASRLGRHDPSIAARGASCLHAYLSARTLADLRAADEDMRPRDGLAELQTRHLLRVALTTESAARLSPLRRAPVASLYTFDVQGGAEVAAVVGIPGDALTPRQEGDVFRYAIPATFSIEYASGHVVRTDTLLELRSPQPLRQEALVPLTMALRTADPDSVTARLPCRRRGR